MKLKNKIIHPDRIEDRSETIKEREKLKIKNEHTGYTSHCVIINKSKNRSILFKSSFVKEKIKTGCLVIFKVVGQNEIWMQEVTPQFSARTSIAHVKKRMFHFLCRYGYKAVLDGTPEPATILFNSGVDPLLSKYRFRIEEYTAKDEFIDKEKVMNYKLIPEKML
ncbi:hypothetical protein [uncultured Bacteroides sp.]|uniref:hypothetical protein n=1 Tax=uncultured Bacteroides sp. TaxID=162156 RepID=UPI0026257D91|nr:hypothetical protein [uncultured Bacteroides sp.]